MYFSSMIYKYKRQYPSSSLLVKEVNTEEGIKMVLDGVLDMSVVIEPFEDQRIEKEPVVLNCTPFVRQYGILSNKWGVLLCQKEYQTNDIRQSSREWL